jgi:hypothetical protein
MKECQADARGVVSALTTFCTATAVCAIPSVVGASACGVERPYPAARMSCTLTSRSGSGLKENEGERMFRNRFWVGVTRRC